MKHFRVVMIPILLLLATIAVVAQQSGAPQFEALPIAQLDPEEIARYKAAEAGQGAAADAEHFYAIVNYSVGQYKKDTAELIGRWQGSQGLQRQSRNREPDQGGQEHAPLGQDQLYEIRGERSTLEDGSPGLQSSPPAAQVSCPWRRREAIHRVADSKVDKGGSNCFLSCPAMACTRIFGVSTGSSFQGGF